jgi:hypothetical protein
VAHPRPGPWRHAHGRTRDSLPGGILRRRRLREYLDDNPDAEADLYALYGFTWGSGLRTEVIESLIRRLPWEPRSLTRAKALGDEKWFGYSITELHLAALIDKVTLLTKAASQRRATLKNEEMFPRPAESGTKRIIRADDAKGMAAYAAMIG